MTTFRQEGSYSDHRHPDAVTFVGDLTTDLSRRDFTMNAIALPMDGLIIDPFGGAEDILGRCVRCVGAPEQRFEEDALRMFRAFRFSSRLGFEIEPGTLEAIVKKAPLASGLAAERIKDEIEKILLSARPETIYTVMSSACSNRFLKQKGTRARAFRSYQKCPEKRWSAALRSVVAFGETASLGLRLSRALILLLEQPHRALLSTCEPRCFRPGSPLQRWSAKHLCITLRIKIPGSCAARFVWTQRSGTATQRRLRSVLEEAGECFSMKHLAVDGDELQLWASRAGAGRYA